MPMTLEAPVLQVDANVIHKVDTTNPANLFSMWTVFARCRDSVAQGRRLENLSWRLWNRETFCCEGDEMFISACATSQPQAIQYPLDAVSEDLPQLSGSVDSVADEEAVDMSTDTTPVDIMRPRIQRQDSCASSRSRGRERHITSDELEKMVQSIMTTKEPFTAPLPSIPRSLSPEKPKASVAPRTERTGSTTSESSRGSPDDESPKSVPSPVTPEPETQSRTIVTRGFSPSQMPVSRITSPASQALSMCAIPEPSDAPAPKIIFSKKQQAKFALGGSSGSEEESYRNRDLEARKLAAQPKGKMFMLGGSSGDASLDGSQQLQRPISTTNAQKKTASFNSQVVTQTYTSSAISDTEDDYDESAIDDDDEDWEEESAEESGDSVAEDKIQFTRVDSSANLPSRRSMITLMLAANNTRAQRLGGNGVASQSTSALPRTRATLNGPALVASPNDSDEAPLMMKRGTTRAPPMRPINEIPRSAAQPINVTAASMHYQAALSPRTTRRNMLATELTESLRRNLLRERSQKTQTANAVLKRRHTSHDVANLKQYPERPFMKKEKEVDTNPSSWDQYFQNPFAAHQAQAW